MNYICVSPVHYIELNINFQEPDYVVNEDDQQGSITLQLREVQNSFTVTLYPVSISEARDSAGRFNVSTFITSVPVNAEATLGKGDTSKVNTYWGLKWRSMTFQQNVISLQECSLSLALVGDDFNTTSITITVPAGTHEEVEIPNRFFFDDEINEIDQSFALVGVLGDDVPDRFACFQRQTGDPLCFGRTGATTIKIEDNDGKVLFFYWFVYFP